MNGKILFPELHPSVVEEWKKRQGAQRGYMGKTKKTTPVKVTQPKTQPKATVSKRTPYKPTGQEWKGTYEDYLNWYKSQEPYAHKAVFTEPEIERFRSDTEKDIESFQALYDKYKVDMIIEKVPQHLKQVVPMDWWRKFEIEGTETGISELDDAISIMEWGLSQGDRNKWTGGMTEIAYAAQRGLITPDEIYYSGLAEEDKAPPHIKHILERMTLDISGDIYKEPTPEEKAKEQIIVFGKIRGEDIVLGELDYDYLVKYDILSKVPLEDLREQGFIETDPRFIETIIGQIEAGVSGEEIMNNMEETWDVDSYMARLYYIKALEVIRERPVTEGT